MPVTTRNQMRREAERLAEIVEEDRCPVISGPYSPDAQSSGELNDVTDDDDITNRTPPAPLPLMRFRFRTLNYAEQELFDKLCEEAGEERRRPAANRPVIPSPMVKVPAPIDDDLMEELALEWLPGTPGYRASRQQSAAASVIENDEQPNENIVENEIDVDEYVNYSYPPSPRAQTPDRARHSSRQPVENGYVEEDQRDETPMHHYTPSPRRPDTPIMEDIQSYELSTLENAQGNRVRREDDDDVIFLERVPCKNPKICPMREERGTEDFMEQPSTSSWRASAPIRKRASRRDSEDVNEETEDQRNQGQHSSPSPRRRHSPIPESSCRYKRDRVGRSQRKRNRSKSPIANDESEDVDQSKLFIGKLPTFQQARDQYLTSPSYLIDVNYERLQQNMRMDHYNRRIKKFDGRRSELPKFLMLFKNVITDDVLLQSQKVELLDLKLTREVATSVHWKFDSRSTRILKRTLEELQKEYGGDISPLRWKDEDERERAREAKMQGAFEKGAIRKMTTQHNRQQRVIGNLRKNVDNLYKNLKNEDERTGKVEKEKKDVEQKLRKEEERSEWMGEYIDELIEERERKGEETAEKNETMMQTLADKNNEIAALRSQLEKQNRELAARRSRDANYRKQRRYYGHDDYDGRQPSTSSR